MRKTKPETNPEFSRSQIRLSALEHNRIDHKMLCKLIATWQAKRKVNPDCPMQTELAEVFLALIEKVIGSNSWRGYSEDWKEEFRGLALCHICKYSIKFNESRSTDAANYFYTMISNAFRQSLKKCKTYSEHYGDEFKDDFDQEIAKLSYIPDYF